MGIAPARSAYLIVYAQVTPLVALILRDPFLPSDKAALRLAGKLALHGAKIEGSGYYARWVPYCDGPVPIVQRSHPRSGLRSVEAGMLVPCRKCARCILYRRMRWRQRIFNEIAQADNAGRRSWFVTLTFSDPHVAGLRMKAAQRVAERGSPWAECFEHVSYNDVQLFHKRLRKRLSKTGRNYRYVAVAEYGEENGRLHYHAIITDTAAPVLYRDILASWRAGFIQAKLVDTETERGMIGAASYVSKYIAKTLSSAVRASAHYGDVKPNNVRK